MTVTTRHRSAVDVLATGRFDDAVDLWAWLSTRNQLTRSDLGQAIRDRLGRFGTPQLLRVLAVTRSGAVSSAEWRLHGILRGARIHGWVAGVAIRVDGDLVAVVDVLFPAERVVIEIDGWRVLDAARLSRR